jgi:hypothetical protein
MTERSVTFAPGCFGSGLAYQEDGTVCGRCDFAARCAPLALERRQQVRARLGIAVEPVVRRVRTADEPMKASRPAGRPRPVSEREGFPKKVCQLLDRIESRGVDLAVAIRAGQNPLPSPAFLKMAIDMLLGGGFDRGQLRAAFMTTFDWSDGTAHSHVGQVFALLTGLKVAREDNGKLMVI